MEDYKRSHLDYKYEPKRITQMEHIISKLELTKHPIVILGDFNALTKNDYSKKKWEGRTQNPRKKIKTQGGKE